MNNPKFYIGQIVYIPECENRILMGSFKKLIITSVESCYEVCSTNPQHNGMFYHLRNLNRVYSEDEIYDTKSKAEAIMDDMYHKRSYLD